MVKHFHKLVENMSDTPCDEKEIEKEYIKFVSQEGIFKLHYEVKNLQVISN
jgi:hypothetical protein